MTIAVDSQDKIQIRDAFARQEALPDYLHDKALKLFRIYRKYDKRLGLRYVITGEGYFQESGLVYLPI